MKNRAFLSIGSNIGKREMYLFRAIKALEKELIEIRDFSSIYETDPVGFTEQDLFLNMVIEIETSKNPYKLLETCLDVEKQLERKRTIRWGPRTIDLDILLFNQEVIESDHLTIPHPRMHERSFVLVPLAEINEELVVPNVKSTVKALVSQTESAGVRLWREKQDFNIDNLFI
jgi:2-amino-4-hydroxy-6-hydroxymethyldihydropteridine diphosphokinase